MTAGYPTAFLMLLVWSGQLPLIPRSITDQQKNLDKTFVVYHNNAIMIQTKEAKKMTSLVVRFSENPSKFETTHQRLKDIAEYLGVSQNKAAAYAINLAWERLAKEEEMLEELEFKRLGRKIGGITYINHSSDFIHRTEKRIDDSIPLPHEDDSELESNLLFQFLSQDQQAAIRAASDPAEKRRLKAKFLKETHPEDAADNLKANFSR